MIRNWLLGVGVLLLAACAVEPVSSNAPEEPALSSEASGLELANPQLICTPGDVRTCCPFPQGCGCRGLQECQANGQFGTCEGATPRGVQCP